MASLKSTPSDPAENSPTALTVDGRQSETARAIQRGVIRVLRAHNFAPLLEVTLANGRRADVMGLSAKGDIWIIEIKSSLEDFRVDQKWPEYKDYCDRLFFAVQPDFPTDVLPDDTGLILADKFGGEIVRDAPEHKVVAARRKAITLQFARTAASRIALAIDPDTSAKADAWRVGL